MPTLRTTQDGFRIRTPLSCTFLDTFVAGQSSCAGTGKNNTPQNFREEVSARSGARGKAKDCHEQNLHNL